MKSLRGDAPEQRRRGAAPKAIALVWTLGVVVAHEAVERALQAGARGEVASAEGHAPELLEDRALQAFDEAVRPGVAGFRAGVPEAQRSTGDIKRPFELGAAVGEHAPDRPARALEMRHDHLAQECGDRRSVVARTQAGHVVLRGALPCHALHYLV